MSTHQKRAVRFVSEPDPLNPPLSIVASAIPDIPPHEWFQNPGLTAATPLTVDEQGRVHGHIAAWGTRHVGMQNVQPPRSHNDYAFFKTGAIKTDRASSLPVGQITLAGGHAPLSADAGAAVKHYDDTNSAVADVNVGEDDHGIWVAGALRPGVSRSQVRALRASAPSGDWRPINGNLELVAICQVNVPGFPVARARVASGAVTALVAAGAQPLFKAKVSHALGTDQEIADLQARVASLEAAAVEQRREALRSRVRPVTGG